MVSDHECDINQVVLLYPILERLLEEKIGIVGRRNRHEFCRIFAAEYR